MRYFHSHRTRLTTVSVGLVFGRCSVVWHKLEFQVHQQRFTNIKHWTYDHWIDLFELNRCWTLLGLRLPYWSDQKGPIQFGWAHHSRYFPFSIIPSGDFSFHAPQMIFFFFIYDNVVRVRNAHCAHSISHHITRTRLHNRKKPYTMYNGNSLGLTLSFLQHTAMLWVR